MNLRHFTIALLMSALPLTAFADYGIILNEGDFKSAKRVSAKGETLLRIKLSKSGKAKLRKLPEEALQKTIQINIDGVTSDLELKAPISGEGIDIGPYPEGEATKIVSAIDKAK